MTMLTHEMAAPITIPREMAAPAAITRDKAASFHQVQAARPRRAGGPAHGSLERPSAVESEAPAIGNTEPLSSVGRMQSLSRSLWNTKALACIRPRHVVELSNAKALAKETTT